MKSGFMLPAVLASRLLASRLLASGLLASGLALTAAAGAPQTDSPDADRASESPQLAELPQPSAAAELPDGHYRQTIKPFLRDRCYGCHGALRQEGSLRLDTVELMLLGGDSGPAIEPGTDALDSLLIQRVAETELAMRMPPEHEGEAFTEAQIEMMRRWIAAGAIGYEGEQPEADADQHWAFRPLIQPAVPDATSAWARNPIDRFIQQQHVEHQLTPLPEVSRSLLLRRLTLDLIGVLPTAAELDAFENDPDADWYEKAVERLLDDPRHGERWARHWMDIWRYSDWWGLGDQLRRSQRHMWKWRDWIIQSLNDDRGYDEMVHRMLAADETHPNDPDELRATGYLARNYMIFNRNQWMDETVEHVSKSLLGLTMNCAKCHDHKYDPISQVDYFRMRAFFEPYQVRVDMVPGETDTTKNGIARVFDADLDAPTYLLERGDEASPDTSRSIAPGLPEILGDPVLPVDPVELPPAAYEPQRHPWVIDNYSQAARAAIAPAAAKRQATADQLAAATAEWQRAEQAAALAAGGDDASSPAAPADATAPAADTALADDFTSLDRSRWTIDSGHWEIADGRLKQSADAGQEASLRYLGQVPEDFDATITFQIHGGQKWKSVGIGFDTIDDQGKLTEQMVYASGVNGGSKVQASYKDQSRSHYPPEAAKAVTLEPGRDYRLRVQARGKLLNVWLDDQRLLAWNSPLPRGPGYLRLITFDCVASIGLFQLAALEPAVELLDPVSGQMLSGDPLQIAQRRLRQAQAADAEAEIQHAIAQATADSIQLRQAAFRAKWDHQPQSVQNETHLAAVTGQRHLDWQRARLAMHQALQKRDSAGEAEREAEEKKYQEAKQTHDEQLARYESVPQLDEPLTPFVGATWSATRFGNTGHDDPQPELPPRSSGRRTALADWITSAENPLTARVAVNHLWTRHLDQPLAATTFDLGRNPAEPVHPELLDWLASELVANDWSMKHIHRLIVNSATYRLGSSLSDAEDQLQIDPDNRYWWRRTPIRVESQVIRDTVLALAGQLDTTIGGPSVPISQQADSKRRSLYFFHSNNDRDLFLTTFDEALVTECYRREQSIVPQQALALTNSALVLDNAPRIARQLAADSADDRQFVRTAFRLVLGMDANDQEMQVALQALERWRDPSNQPDAAAPDQSDAEAETATERARGYLIWALLNHNDFVTLR